MNTEAAEPVAPAVEPAPAAPVTPEPLPDLPLSEHEEEFPILTRAERAAEKRASRAPAPSGSELGTAAAPAADGSTPESDVRDDKGRFRHRAKSQQASAADVPRINELTAKLRAAEARAADAEARATRAPAPTAATAPPPIPVPRVASTVSDTPPQFKTFLAELKANETYDDAVQRHAEAVATWQWQRGQHQQAQQQAEQHFYDGFKQKIAEAAKVYPDFQAVAMDPDSVIPPGSLIDSWVWEHPAGAHVLYHMQKNPGEVARIHALPTRLEQLSELSLLSQRLTHPQAPVAAVPTGSAPVPPVTPAPKPPNPVRTGPLKAADTPPGDDASLAEHEKFYNQPRRRP